ncbi:MAG: Hsp33 family molecular chaperone HslO [Candidatus Promineifilaceae bacterium]
MGDYVVRSVAKQAGVRVMVCITTEIAAEGARRHKTTPTATVALGRALTVGTLAGSLLKRGHRVALKFDGNGPLGKLIAESDSWGRVRGYVQNPKVEVERDEFGRINIPAAVGIGVLSGTKDVQLPKLIEGAVELLTSNISDDFAYYLIQSEQIPSVVQAGVVLNEDGSVAAAGGVLVQTFGDSDVTQLDAAVERLEELPPIEEMLNSGRHPEDIIADIYGEFEHKILEDRRLFFECKCSVERSEAGIVALGRTDLEQLIEEGQALVDCHFCHEQYVFEREDLEDLLAAYFD